MLTKLVLSSVAGLAVAGGAGSYVVHEKDVTIDSQRAVIATQYTTITRLEARHTRVLAAIKAVQAADDQLLAAVKETP